MGGAPQHASTPVHSVVDSASETRGSGGDSLESSICRLSQMNIGEEQDVEEFRRYYHRCNDRPVLMHLLSEIFDSYYSHIGINAWYRYVNEYGSRHGRLTLDHAVAVQLKDFLDRQEGKCKNILSFSHFCAT